MAGGVRRTWAEVTDRTRRLAAVLADAGIGLRADVADPGAGAVGVAPRPRGPLPPQRPRVPRGHARRLEGPGRRRQRQLPLRGRRAALRAAPTAGAAAVVFHGAFAATLAEVLPDLPAVAAAAPGRRRLGAPPAAGRRRATRTPWPRPRPVAPVGPVARRPLHPLHGRHHRACPRARCGARATSSPPRSASTAPLDQIVADGAARRRAAHAAVGAVHARRRPLERPLARGRRAAPWSCRTTPPASTRPTCWPPARASGSTSLQIVGDPFARPLLDELDGATTDDLSDLRFLLSGGAVLSAAGEGPAGRAALPGLRIVDVLGSSETGRQAVAGQRRPAVPARAARPSCCRPTAPGRLAPGDDEVGWLAQAGRVPLGYLGDQAKTAATFPVVDGVRYAVAGDRVRLRADGTIELLGRDSVTINTGGEKVFAEEVEQALTAHPAVADAVVVGRPSERWGSEIVAVLSARPGVAPPADDELRAHCRGRLAGYKVPKAFCWVDEVVALPRRQARLRLGPGRGRRCRGRLSVRRTRRWCSARPARPRASAVGQAGLGHQAVDEPVGGRAASPTPTAGTCPGGRRPRSARRRHPGRSAATRASWPAGSGAQGGEDRHLDHRVGRGRRPPAGGSGGRRTPRRGRCGRRRATGAARPRATRCSRPARRGSPRRHERRPRQPAGRSGTSSSSSGSASPVSSSWTDRGPGPARAATRRSSSVSGGGARSRSWRSPTTGLASPDVSADVATASVRRRDRPCARAASSSAADRRRSRRRRRGRCRRPGPR